MSRRVRWAGFAAIAAVALTAGDARAAISSLNTWASQHAGTGFPAVNVAYSAPAGANRVLVVAIASTRTAVGAVSCTATYGGTGMTPAADDGAVTTIWNHTFLYVIPIGTSASATSQTLAVSCSGGTSFYSWVYARVYAGVDQTAPTADVQNFNSATADNVVGPFNPTLAIGANDLAIEIVNLARSTVGTTARTIQTWASTWPATPGVAPASYAPATNSPTATMYIQDRAIPAAATTDTSQHTAGSTSTWDSMTALVLNVAPTASTQLVTGTNPGAATVCPGQTGVYADQFGFTVTTTADRVSALTVSGLGATTPVAAIRVADDTGATILSATPTGNTQAFSFTTPNLAAPVGTTNYRLYFDLKDHAAITGAATSVTPIVTTYTSTNAQTAGTDTANAFTIDNTAQANVASSTVGSPTSTSLTLSLGASTGLAEYVVWARKGAAPTDNPVDGTQYSVGTPDPANSWVAYVGSAANPTISGLDPSSTYYFRIFARDACFNYSTTAATANGTTAAPAASTQLVTGTNPAGNTAVCPGATNVYADQFGFTVTTTADRVSALTVSGLAATTPIAAIRVTNDAGTTIATATPTGDTQGFTFTSPNLAAPVGTTSYRLYFDVKAHGAAPAGNTTVTPIVASYGSTNPQTAGADTANAFTIDHTAQANVGGSSTNTPTASSLTLALGASAGLAEYVVWARKGVAPIDNPADGTQYAPGTPDPANSWVAYVGTSATPTISGLDPSSTYYFRIFARDACFNYSTTAATASGTTSAPPSSIQLVTGTNPPGNTALCPGATGVYADQFGFAVTGLADRVSALTVSGLGATTPLAALRVTDDAGATIATATPTGATQAFSFTSPNLAAPVGTTSYRLYFDVKSHADLAAGNFSATPIVASYTSSNPQTAGTDGANAFTVDNTAQATPAASSTNTPTASSLTLALGASAGLAEYVVWARKGSGPTDSPVDGTLYVVGTPHPTNSWVAYVGSAASPTISGLDPSSTYYFRIFARDACFNYSGSVATSGTTSAVAQTITVANGTLVTPATIAPGSTSWTPVDTFSVAVTSGAPTNTLQSVTYTSLAGMSQYLAGVRLVRASDSAVLSTVNAPSGDAWTFTGLSETISSAAAQYRLELQPKGHAAMPAIPGGNLVLAPGSGAAGVVTAVGTATAATMVYSDGNAPDPATGQVLVDNLSPADVNTVAATGGPGDVHLSWVNPGADLQKIVILAKPGAAFLASERPAEGDDPALNAAYGAATVRYLGTTSPQAITGLSPGTWYFKLFARDASGNFSAGVETSAVVPDFIADGDATKGSEKPVVSIVNPMKGAVVAVPFRVQARIFSPKTSGGVSQPIGEVTLLVDDVPSSFTMAPLAAYGTTTESGVWGTSVSTLAVGTHTLRVFATNAAGTVYSGTLAVRVVPPNTGDGNMLVRDNASQLCSDCHAMKTHSSETTGNALGSWAVTCRECHTPHDTTNLGLLRTKIKPPELEGPTTEKDVVFLNRSGYAAGSFASSSNNGPCQVCHTQTDYYRSTGEGPGGPHETGDCSTCHVHNKGLAASCTTCHGTESRGSIAGADQRQSAAPPAVAAGSVSVPGGGAHVAHVNQATWRTNPLPCLACHPPPHTTKGATDIRWSTLATGNGAIADASMNPPAGTLGSAWPTTPSCTNWCHGGGMPAGGGSHPSPGWTETATAAQCGTCHASPPPVGGGTGRDHPQNTACAICHGAGYAQASLDPTAKATHVDGTIQKPLNGCTACHGKLAGPAPAVAAGSTTPAAAPGYDALSVDTRGNTSSTVPLPVGVGAHGKHVNDGMMSAKTCDVCHPLPGDGDTAHANGAVAMAWSSPANAGGVSPGYTRPSCTNYCHSAGDPMGAAVPAPAPISWTSAGPLGCASCHPSSAIATNAHDRHVPKYACSECHVATTLNGTSIVTGGGLHVNGANDVGFDASSMFVQGGSYTSPTCSNVYCHSDGTKRSPPYVSGPSVAWTGTTGCTSCHGGPVGAPAPMGQIATGKHGNHVNLSAAIGGAASTNLECGTCHAATVAVNTDAPVTGASAHVDRIPSVSFDPFYGGSFSQGATEGTGSCASNYCHSSGQDPAATPAIIQYVNVAWNDAARGCDGCHGRYGGTGNGTGAPNYPSGGQAAPTANSHARHVSAATDCAICHAGTATAAGGAILATSTLHLDKQRQVQLDSSHDLNGATSNYDPGTKTCSGVSCHGSAGQPKWGGPPMKCSDCHAGTGDTDSFALLTPGVIDTGEWSARGHGQATFGVNTFPTLASGTPCLYCHDASSNHRDGANPFRLRGSTAGAGAPYSAATPSSANQVCLNCHAQSGAPGVNPPDSAELGTNPAITSTKKIDAFHAGAKHGAANGGTRCWDCHDPHGDGSNIAMIGSKVVRTATDNHSFAATRVTGVTFTANAAGTDYAGAGTKICNACHASTSYYLANGTGDQTHQSGAKCVACHGHQQAPDLAFKQSTACNACHNSPPTVGNHAKHIEAIQASPAYGSTTIGSSGTTYGYQCGICHTTAQTNHVKDTGGTVADPYVVNVAFSIGSVTTYTQGATPATETGPTGLVFKGTNGSCATVYCHDPLGAAYTGTNVNWTQTPGSLGCTACHPMNGAASTALTNRHDQHINAPTGTPAGYGYGCERCHSSTTTTGNSITNTAQHAVGTHNVAFNSNPVNQTGGTYTIGSNGACGNTYCHSNGQSTSSFGPPNVNLAWNAASGTATCSSCHGGATGTIIASGKHTQHVNNPTWLTTSYYCADCHATTVTGTATPAVNYAGGKHVNAVKDVSIGNRGTAVSSDTSASCSNTYCHSDGQRGAANTRWAVTWSDAAWATTPAPGICVRCHGTEGGSIAGEPRYANGGANTATANSHAAHVKAGTDCATCHNGIVNAAGTVVTSASHTNGAIDTVFDLTKAGNGAVNSDGTYTAPSTYVSATCTSVKCHGTNTTPVSWGATLDCSGCHMGPTGTTDAEVDDFNYGNGTTAMLDPEDWINNGHGRPSGSYDSGTGAAAFDTAIGVSSDDGCKYCHDKNVLHGQFGTSANPFRLANVGAGNTAALKNGVCTVCHGGAGYLGKTSAKAIDASHHGTKHATTNGGELCWDCHDPHGDSRYTTNATETPVVGTNELLGYMIDAKLVTTHPTAEGNTTEWGTNGTAGPTYAPSAPRFNKALVAPATSYDWGDYVISTSPFNGVCQTCHTATVHFKNTAWSTTIPSHGDADSTHNTGGGRCTKCHAHDQVPSDAFRASCSGCHGNKGTARTPVTANADAMLDYAPPTAADGTTAATTDDHVGAHQSHVNQITLRTDPLLCSECHGSSLPVHPGTGTANIAWGSLATTGSVTPSYLRGTGCSATYCHGNFKNGNDQITPKIPGAPGALSFSAITDTGLTVSWGGATGAVVYKVERAPDVSGAPGTFVQVGTATGTSYTDAGLWAATPYWYRVRAWSSLGDGAYSGNASARTTGGNIGTYTAADFDMVGEDTATSLDGGATNITVAATTATATTTVDNRNIATVNYTYANTTQRRLRPAAAISSGTYYFVDIFSPALTASDNVIAAGASVSIDWLMATVGTVTNAYWTVTLYEYKSNGSSTQLGTCNATYNSTTSTSTRGTSTCTLDNVQYVAEVGSRLKLRILQAPTGNWGRTGLLWGATTGTTYGQTWFRASRASLTAPTPPAAPAGSPALTMGVSTQTTIAMSWTAVTGATSYKVERSPNGTSGWVQVAQPAATSFTDSALTASTTYFYRVRASNAGGDAPSYSGVQQSQTAALVANATSWSGNFTPGATTLTCTSCHGDPPGGTHPAASDCNVCHPGYSANAVVKATHINGTVEKETNCTVCHALQLGSRRPIVPEFGMAWSHKRSGGGTVTNYDCIVCHMEGDPTTGLPTDGGAHMNGVLNLRDPDTGANIKGVTFSVALGGTTAGTYASTGNDAAPAEFSRNLASATIEPDVAAIQVNLCLKCHDSNGATAFLASNPNAGGAQGALYPMRAQGGTRTAEKPFGTSISYASIPAASGQTATPPSGTQTAGGISGGVIDVATSFLTSNSSYHPVSGRNNNSYAYNTRMATPWNATWTPARAAGSVNNFGYLISCWDCHAQSTDTGTITKTVTAHGGTETLRGNATASGTNPTATTGSTLCWKCHALYNTGNNHGANSAFNTSADGGMTPFVSYGCNRCHASTYTETTTGYAVRPVRAEDVHGNNRLPGTGTDVMWPTGTTESRRPVAFIRQTKSLSNHQPGSINGTSYGGSCTHLNDGACSSRTETYTPGGTY